MRPIVTVGPMVLAAVLTACTVGPDYAGPPALSPAVQATKSFHRAADIALDTAPPASRWWLSLGDPVLDDLIQDALASSPTVAEAAAKIGKSRAKQYESERDMWPKLSASTDYLNIHIPGSTLGEPGEISSETYSNGLSASWELDLFGKLSRTAERDRLKADAAEAQLSDTQVTLIADVAQAYVDLRDTQARLDLGRRALSLQEQERVLVASRVAGGTATTLDLTRLDSQLEQARSDLLPLQTQIDAKLDQLAVLTGQQPGALDDRLSAAAPLPQEPEILAIGDPASVIRRRPDVRQAERSLASATAEIGMNMAKMFPTLKLNGLASLAGQTPGSAFDPGNLMGLMVPGLSWDILDFGRTCAQVRQAKAGRDEAVAHYQTTVLRALQDAEGGLSRLRHQREGVSSAGQSFAIARRAADVARSRYAGGTGSRVDELDGERQQMSAEAGLIHARAVSLSAYVALQKSLGLGWEEPAPSSDDTQGGAG